MYLRRRSVMKSKSKKNSNVEDTLVIPTEMSSVMANCFNRYAKAVLLDRAIPDVRDGLKPVQRRIIYTMYESGNVFSKPTRKCARTVGDVMGKYHPHGDSSIYEALVRMSQDWKMEVPLIAFQGNNGSIDNDPAAAYRYTESKLAKISELLVQDIEKDTVNMTLNFDDSLLEPTVLPARFPNLLVNGSQGIGVGAVTNIPCHNLDEVIDATIYRIEHKRSNVQDLLQFIKGPDFPTGGKIDDREALNKLYETGQASFFIHCDARIDEKTNQIIIEGLPYGTVKSQFVADLDKRRIQDNLDNIEEIRDESTDDIRIVIDVKEGQSAKAVLYYLRSKGALRSTFSANMLAIDKGHPKTMNLLEILNAYIAHQQDVIRRRSKFDIEKKTLRLEVVEGLIKAVSIIDKVIEVIKSSKGREDSKANIMNEFGFSERQAEAIVTMQLYRLSNTDVTALMDEKDQLNKDLAELKEILANEDKLDRLIVKDLKKVKETYVTPRKTTILDEKLEIKAIDPTKLIAKEDCYVTLTRDGYIKRTNLRSYQASINADKSNVLPKIKQGDGIVLCLQATTHDMLIAFLESGSYIVVPVYQIPDVKWKEEGKHINTLLNSSASDKVIEAFIINDFDIPTYFALLTKKGKIKRTLVKEFEQNKLTTRPLKAIGLTKGDTLVSVKLTTGNSNLLVVQENGFSSCYNENEVPAVGIKANGVKAINMGKDMSPLISLIAFDSDEYTKLFILSDNLCARVITSTNIDVVSRLGMKQQLVKIFKSCPQKLVSVDKVKVERNKENNVYIYTEDTNEIINIDSLDTVLIGSGMKPNIPLKGKKIIGRHFEGSTIDKDCKIEEPQMVVETTKVKDVSGDKQMTLFDLFDEEK